MIPSIPLSRAVETQGQLFEQQATEPCRYSCDGTAVLGPARYNATRTAMNQTRACV